MVVTGYLTFNLDETEGDWREEEIAAALTAAGLEEMLAHFLPKWCPWCQDGRTWIMVRLGMEVQSWTYYILGTAFRLFRDLDLQYPRHNLNHYLVLGCLRSSPLREHTKYLGRSMRLPLWPLTIIDEGGRALHNPMKGYPKA